MLALGELGESGGGTRDGGGKAAGDLVEQLPSDRGGEHGVAGGDGAHGLDDLLRGRVLEQKAAGAGAQRVDDVLVEAEGGEDQHPLARQPAGGLDPVHAGHADVHEHDVGCAPGGGLDRLCARAGLGHDLDVAGRFEYRPKAGAHHRLVVGDDHAQGHDPPPSP